MGKGGFQRRSINPVFQTTISVPRVCFSRPRNTYLIASFPTTFTPHNPILSIDRKKRSSRFCSHSRSYTMHPTHSTLSCEPQAESPISLFQSLNLSKRSNLTQQSSSKTFVPLPVSLPSRYTSINMCGICGSNPQGEATCPSQPPSLQNPTSCLLASIYIYATHHTNPSLFSLQSHSNAPTPSNRHDRENA